MSSSIASFWRQLPTEAKPYIHPSDKDLLKTHGQCLAVHHSWKEFITHAEWNTPKDSAKLQVSLVPVPYVGDITKAEIIILMLNPGFLPINIWVENKMADWTSVLWKNLHQEFDDGRVPFIFLDPEYAWHPGFIYWASRFRKTLLHIMEKKSLPYPEALKWLGQRIACLQLVPYASMSFYLPQQLIKSLPSVRQATDFARENLLAGASTEEKLLIVARQAKTWELPAHKNVLCLKNTTIRGARFENDSQVLDRVWGRLGL